MKLWFTSCMVKGWNHGFQWKLHSLISIFSWASKCTNFLEKTSLVFGLVEIVSTLVHVRTGTVARLKWSLDNGFGTDRYSSSKSWILEAQTKPNIMHTKFIAAINGTIKGWSHTRNSDNIILSGTKSRKKVRNSEKKLESENHQRIHLIQQSIGRVLPKIQIQCELFNRQGLIHLALVLLLSQDQF